MDDDELRIQCTSLFRMLEKIVCVLLMHIMESEEFVGNEMVFLQDVF